MFQLEDLLESQRNAWSMKVQKIESDKNDLYDKKEEIFVNEVENLKLQFIEEKEQFYKFLKTSFRRPKMGLRNDY